MESFLLRIITGDEKLIYFENPKRKKIMGWSKLTINIVSEIEMKKALLPIWWYKEGVSIKRCLKRT